MSALVAGASKRHVTAPLVSDFAIVHHAPHDTQHLSVKEEFRSEARWLEGHRKKVPMRAAVRLATVVFEISEEYGPKRLSASIDHRSRKMCPEHAIALVLDLENLLFDHHQCGTFQWSTSLSNKRPIRTP